MAECKFVSPKTSPEQEFQLEKQQMITSHQKLVLQLCFCQQQPSPLFGNDIQLPQFQKTVAREHRQAYMMKGHEPAILTPCDVLN